MEGRHHDRIFIIIHISIECLVFLHDIFIYLFIAFSTIYIYILHIIICLSIQDDSRVIMSSTELKMQPTIHLQRKAGYYRVHIQVCFANVLWVAF
jgi:hypothetical protein